MTEQSTTQLRTTASSTPDSRDVEKSAPAPQSNGQQQQQHQQYSVFTINQRRAIISTGSFASFFSPLSSSIYFPALDTIAIALDVSVSKINLTVTTYLACLPFEPLTYIMQGIAPMLISGFADSAGRRPAYIICFTVYIGANIGLSLQSSYAALMVLRFLQSGGSSGTVALANGLVGDTITSAERGSYIAFASLGSMLGPSLSPIIGGLISQYLDWHWIFWFLLIFSSVFFAGLLCWLPETCRKIVGDGSLLPPPPLNNSVTDIIRYRRRKARGIVDQANEDKRAELRKNYKLHIPNPLSTLRVIVDLETSTILTTTGLLFASYYAVMTGATTSFHTIYKLNDIQTGLMYLPIGAGGVFSAFTTGRVVDWNYRRHANLASLPVVPRGVRQDLSHFNVERARLEVALPAYLLSNVIVLVYGWVLDAENRGGHASKVGLAGPIVLLFFSGWTLNASSQVLNALMVDLWPGRSASATAANNFFRCELGAAASAAIGPMADAMGQGWAYTTLALLSMAASPMFLVVMKYGMGWRQKRWAVQK